MHEIAEPATVAVAEIVLTTAGFSEVGDGGQLGKEGASWMTRSEDKSVSAIGVILD